MDPSNRRPQLPALSYLDVDKVKREEEAYHNLKNGNGTSQILSTTAAPSPTYHYPPGPPPPYSHTHGGPPAAPHANTWTGAQSRVRTPPEPRRASEHEQEGAKQATRQSLPSISEALGVDSQTSFSSAAAPPLPLQSTHLSQPPSAAPASPSANSRRSYAMEPPQLVSSTTYPQPSPYRHEPPQSHTYPPPPAETARTPAAYPPVQEAKPPLPLQTSRPLSRPAPSLFSRPPVPSPTYEHPPTHSSGAMGPPSFPYGHVQYPPRYANPTPPSSVSSAPIYQSSLFQSAPQTTPGCKLESASRYDDRQPSQVNYGDSVKRHLDFYDLEMALNEIGATSGILTDFARRYGDRMHQTQRSGASLSTLPGIVEVDDMVAKSRVQLESLLKIRDVIITQQAAYEQQAADQRQQHKAFNEPPPPQADLHQQEVDDKAGGFPGVDNNKKRRGRAAPPGRCHSCNRAETPEWRRGPDGARTLCNACGLHYAKLTRKNNGASKSTSVGSSNLRPKESM